MTKERPSRTARSLLRQPRRIRHRPQPGAAPGTYVPDPEAIPTQTHVIEYDSDHMNEHALDGGADAIRNRSSKHVTWINVDGLGDHAEIESISAALDLHPLTLADIFHTHQRAKVEDYDSYVYITLRMPTSGDPVETEQISLVLAPGVVMTVQERPGDCFDEVRKRIRESHRRIRKCQSDYLAYALLDAVVDAWFPLLDQISESMDQVEEAVLQTTASEVTNQIHRLRADMLTIRRSIWPLRDAISRILRDESKLFTKETRLYLRDCHDHASQIIDLVENYRERCSSLLEIQLSQVSQRTNDVMKVLAIISTLFIPLSFIAGLYGMNFNPNASSLNMPETQWAWGYPVVLGVMVIIATTTLLIFWRSGWIGDRGERSSSQ